MCLALTTTPGDAHWVNTTHSTGDKKFNYDFRLSREFEGLNRVFQRRNGLKQIRHQPVIRHLKNRRFFVFVDCHDDL